MKELLKKKANTEEEAIKRLADIIRILRVECPWDKEQTHKSLETCLIEEAHEVIEAIERESDENLREELGDVLLQVVFHSSIAEEEGRFTLTDVINEECEKMIRRHPHVFSLDTVKTVDKVLKKWENIKGIEHIYSSYTEELKDVPKSFPALIRSGKVQKKAAKVGFDWDDTMGALEKLQEEIGELTEAVRNSDLDNMFEEFGDLLFSMVNVSRFLKIDPELALTKSTEKFINRFEAMENLARERNLDLNDMTLKEMDQLWDEIKSYRK